MIAVYIIISISIIMMFMPDAVISYLELTPDGQLSLLNMFSGQILHFSWQHLFFDALMLVICAFIIGKKDRKDILWLLIASLICCGITAEFCCQEFAVYRGLSGVSSAFYIEATLIIAKEHPYLGCVAILLFAIKLVGEFCGMQALFGGDGFTPTPWVHLAGALVAFTGRAKNIKALFC